MPDGIRSTGWPAVERVCRDKLGILFDRWQSDIGRIILSKRADGKLANMIGGVGMSLPRQVGKTYLISGMIFALCILKPGLLVIWSSHHGKTHGETFAALRAFADSPRVKPYIKVIYTGSGDEEIQFTNGARILFGARERGFGRGIPGVDVIVSDEAQIMSDKALDAQLATLNTSDFGLAIFIGTPPRPDDPSEAFTRMRTDAWSGAMEDSTWIELAAERGAALTDRKQWARANPSYPHRTPPESILRLLKKLKPDSFRREALGIWDEESTGGALPFGTWSALADPKIDRGYNVVFGLDIAEDRTAWIAVAWTREDGKCQVMLTNGGQPLSVHRLAAEAGRLSSSWHGRVVPPKSMLDELRKTAGVDLWPMPAGEFAAACGGLLDMITAGTIHHGNQPELNESVKAAKWRPTNVESERAFLLKGCPEIGPVAAVTRAVHGWRSLSNGGYDPLGSVL